MAVDVNDLHLYTIAQKRGELQTGITRKKKKKKDFMLSFYRNDVYSWVCQVIVLYEKNSQNIKNNETIGGMQVTTYQRVFVSK